MKIPPFFNKSISLRYRLLANKYANQAKKSIDSTAKNLGQEAKETQEMAQTFFCLLENKLNMQNRTTPPSSEEIKVAIEQLKDVGRFTIFTSISILPGGAFSLIGLELLAKKFNVKNFTLIPSSFKKA